MNLTHFLMSSTEDVLLLRSKRERKTTLNPVLETLTLVSQESLEEPRKSSHGIFSKRRQIDKPTKN